MWQRFEPFYLRPLVPCGFLTTVRAKWDSVITMVKTSIRKGHRSILSVERLLMNLFYGRVTYVDGGYSRPYQLARVYVVDDALKNQTHRLNFV